MIFDSSALMPLLVSEARSVAVERIARRETPVGIPALAVLECYDAIGRAVRDRRCDADGARQMRALFHEAVLEGHFRVIQLSPRHVAVARAWLESPELALTAFDAVHVAVAHDLDETLLTAGRAQARAAKRLGVRVRVV